MTARRVPRGRKAGATTRREFVLVSGAAVVAATTGCGGGGAAAPASPVSPSPQPTPAPPAPNQVRLALPAVGQTAGATGQLLGPLPMAVTRVNATTVVAVSRICTHEACTVDLPTAPLGSLDCPCHGSRFQVTGQVINGPAPRALASFPTAIDGNDVIVTLPST